MKTIWLQTETDKAVQPDSPSRHAAARRSRRFTRSRESLLLLQWFTDQTLVASAAGARKGAISHCSWGNGTEGSRSMGLRAKNAFARGGRHPLAPGGWLGKHPDRSSGQPSGPLSTKSGQTVSAGSVAPPPACRPPARAAPSRRRGNVLVSIAATRRALRYLRRRRTRLVPPASTPLTCAVAWPVNPALARGMQRRTNQSCRPLIGNTMTRYAVHIRRTAPVAQERS